jgi:maltose O-acetyltransferase
MIPKVLRHSGANIGENVRVKAPVTFNDVNGKSFHNLSIGSNVFIGRNCLLDLQDRIIIGNNATLSHNVSLLTHTDAGNSPVAKNKLVRSHSPITIGCGVYIGFGVTLLQGVHVGDNAIIGAVSLVNKDIPEGSTAYGIPAKAVVSE